MKKNLLVLLLVVFCFALVGCAKDEKKPEKKTEKVSVKTLECKGKSDDEEVSMTIEQDQKTYKFTKATMVMSAPKKAYADLKKTDKELEELLCEDEDAEYKECKVEFNDDKLVVTMVFDTSKFEKEIKEDEDMKIEKFDKNTLSKIKEFTEKDNDNYTCTIK